MRIRSYRQQVLNNDFTTSVSGRLLSLCNLATGSITCVSKPSSVCKASLSIMDLIYFLLELGMVCSFLLTVFVQGPLCSVGEGFFSHETKSSKGWVKKRLVNSPHESICVHQGVCVPEHLHSNLPLDKIQMKICLFHQP